MKKKETNQDNDLRKKAEEALHKSEIKYRTLVDNANEAILVAQDGMFKFVNRRFMEMIGFSEQELMSKPFTEFVHPDDRGLVAENHKKRMKGEYVSPRYTFRILTSNGRPIWVEIGAALIEWQERPATINLLTDITDRKLAEMKLKESEERYRHLFERAPFGIGMATMDGEILACNKMMERITGYSEDEFKKINIQITYVNPDDRTKLLEVIKKSGGVYDYPTMLKRKDGTEYHASLTIGIVNIMGKDVVQTLIQDITERKRMEEALGNVQKLESLGILAGGIAHDFNNLLAQIFGFIQLAYKKSNDANITDYLSRTLSTMDRAKALTGQLMAFAKGGSPKKKVRNLFPFIEETVGFSLSGSNVNAQYNIEPCLWMCDIDENQISQVLDNIIINAVQAMPLGGKIEIVAKNIILASQEHTVLGKGNYVRISIKDNGIGITKEILPHVFDPFFTTKTKGHGLGLAMSHTIIMRHKGYIDVDSEPGKGSTFNIYLPAFMGAVNATANNVTVEHSGCGTFLVLDDEPGILTMVSFMLETFGYSAVCLDNGDKILDFYVQEKRAGHAIVGMIFDLTIPGGRGGKETIAEIRKLNRETPAFVMSGYSEDPVMSAPWDHGFTASICKPFRIEQLSEILNSHMPTGNAA